MAAYDYDLFVIGAGSGGVRAGRLAAAAGARVAVAEEYRVGGTCVIRGCVPKKFMVYASEFSNQADTAEKYGWTVGERSFDWARFMAAKDKEIARLSSIYVANLEKAGATIILDRAVVTGPHSVRLVKEGREVTAEKILVATGGSPTTPANLEGVEHVITSNEALHLPSLPKSVIIAGGGYIAVEFAGIFNGLGSKVTLVHRGDKLLRGFDEDIRTHLGEELTRRGIDIRLHTLMDKVTKTDEGVNVHFVGGGAVTADVVMFATGRSAHTQGLGLEDAGVELAMDGAVLVDEWSRSNVPSIWAVGDVTDRINLTPVAIREGAGFAETEFKDNPTKFDHADVAAAVFSQPPVGVVGLTEAQAREQFGEVDIYRATFRPMKITFYDGQERMLLKLVVKADDQRVVGVHMVGPDAPEIIQMAAIAVKAGLTKAQWDATCAVHPTVAEEFVTMKEKVG